MYYATYILILQTIDIRSCTCVSTGENLSGDDEYLDITGDLE